MTDLWKSRLRRHQLDQFKYLRLIFNDTFVLAFIVLLGALGFWYSNLLDTIKGELWFGKLVVVVLLLITAQAGKMATMMESPDSTFLLVREKEFYQYFCSAQNYSKILPTIFIIAVTFLLSPFASRAASMSILDIVLLGIATILFKLFLLDIQFLGLYGEKNLFGVNGQVVADLFYLVAMLVSVYTSTIVAVVALALACLYSNSRVRKLAETGKLQWQKAIDDENQRMFKLKRFYNLFTDVPGISSKIKRRKWLDFLFNGIKLEHKNTYLYLFARGVVRNNEYMGLFLRLTIVQVVLLALIDNFYISLIVEMLFIYLVGFQLKPYFKEVMQNMMQRMYPVSSKSKIADFAKISNIMLLIQWFISIFAIVYKFQFSTNTLIIVLAGLVVILFLNYVYMPRQLRKYINNGEY